MRRDEVRDLLPARALGALDADEAKAVDAAVASDPELRSELDDLRASVASMHADLPPGRPPARLLGDVFDRIDALETPAPDPRWAREDPPVRPLATTGGREIGVVRRATRRRRIIAAGLAAAAVVLALAVVVLASTRSGDPVSGRAALEGHGAHGQARLYRDHVVVQLSDLAPPPAGHHYQVWVLPRGSVAMRSVGTLRPRDGKASLQAALPGGGPFAAVDVSVDPDDRPSTEPGPSVVRAPFS
jgi:anti-sigma-K factor RskA